MDAVETYLVLQELVPALNISSLTPKIKLVNGDPTFIPIKNKPRDAAYDIKARIDKLDVSVSNTVCFYERYLESISYLSPKIVDNHHHLPKLWLDGSLVISTAGEVESGLKLLRSVLESTPAIAIRPQNVPWIEEFNVPFKFKVPCGFAIALPQMPSPYVAVAQIYPRSGLGVKHDIVLGNSVGIVDEPYRGEILACLFNRGSDVHVFTRGARIAQMMLTTALDYGQDLSEFVVDELDETDRGDSGFNSSGLR